MAGEILTGDLLTSGLFSTPIPFPGSLFSGGYVGAWLDINDLSLLYTTDTGSTHVASVSDAIGRAVTKSGGTVNALQATASLRPILGQWPSGGRYYAYHDRVDDLLTLAGMPAGTYTIGTASFSGVQVYENIYSSGTLSIPSVDATEIFIINRSLSGIESAALYSYLSGKTPTIGSTDVFRACCASSSVDLSITESGSSGATWELGDGQTATGTSCVKTITSPQSVILRATNPSAITQINFTSKSLYGQWVDFGRLTGLQYIYGDQNSFTGRILPVSHMTSLLRIYLDRNKLRGKLPAIALNPSLVVLYAHTNQLTGTIPSPASNPNLVYYTIYTNMFDDYEGGDFPATLSIFNAQNCLLSSSAVNSILAGAVAGGRTSASGICQLVVSGGSNGAPTGQGITDKATLISRGWTVTTN